MANALSLSVIHREDDIVVISVGGELDVASSAELRTHLDALATGAPAKVVIDLSRLDFIDSGGLNVLVLGARAIEAGGGSFVLASPAPLITNIFEVVQLASQIPVEDSLDGALGRLAATRES